MTKEPGSVFYYFNGQHYAESLIVDQFREFVAGMRVDLHMFVEAGHRSGPYGCGRSSTRRGLLAYLEVRTQRT